MIRYQTPLVRVRLDSLAVEGADPTRAYSLVMDPVAGLATLSWGNAGRKLSGPSGLILLQTHETMESHSARGVFGVGEMGAVLKDLVECQDTLLIEFFDGERWNTAFDGFVGAISVTHSGTTQSLSWRLELAAEGLQRMLSQQWFNWFAQVSPEAFESFRIFGTGSKFYREAESFANSVPAKELVRMILKHAVGTHLGFTVRGIKAGLIEGGEGGTFQCGTGPSEWSTPFDLMRPEAAAWYTSLNGPVMSILGGLSEPDACEFFLTYRPIGGDSAKPDVPTWVFRAKPWPWWSEVSENDAPIPEMSDWNALKVVKVGGQFGPGPHSVNSTKHDASRNNAWVYSIDSASDASSLDLMGKFQRGVWSDDLSIKRYGFSMKQVTLGSYIPGVEIQDIGRIWDRLIAMNAWQDAPLPRLTSQARSYPLLSGVHVGTVLEDHSDSEPMTGYIVGVTHTFQGGASSLGATTSISVSRCLSGATKETYPDTVRAKVAMKIRKFKMSPAPEIMEAISRAAIATQNQPGEAWTFDSRLVHPKMFKVLNGTNDEVTRNLSWLTQTLRAVEISLGQSVTVTSGLRDYTDNIRVGGRDGSLHMKGLAFDMQAGDASWTRSAYEKLRSSGLKFAEFYLGDKDGKVWIHIGVSAPADSMKPAVCHTVGSDR